MKILLLVFISEIKIDLTLKKSNFLLLLCFKIAIIKLFQSPVLRIDNQQNFKIMKISILLKSFISLFYIIRYIL